MTSAFVQFNLEGLCDYPEKRDLKEFFLYSLKRSAREVSKGSEDVPIFLGEDVCASETLRYPDVEDYLASLLCAYYTCGWISKETMVKYKLDMLRVKQTMAGDYIEVRLFRCARLSADDITVNHGFFGKTRIDALAGVSKDSWISDDGFIDTARSFYNRAGELKWVDPEIGVVCEKLADVLPFYSSVLRLLRVKHLKHKDVYNWHLKSAN